MLSVPALLLILLMQAPSTGEPIVFIQDPAALQSLEQQGLALQDRLGSPEATHTQALARKSPWGKIARVLGRDLDAIMRADKRAGPSLRYSHRLFHKKWLKSESTRFELIGVANRLDREAFEPGQCGETRLVYRLGYTRNVGGTEVQSRLPITLNLVYWQQPPPGEAGCAEVARRWLAKPANSVATQLRSEEGPLHPGALELENLKSLEINIQSVRWPSTTHPSLAGHAEYLMRVFKYKNGNFKPAGMENTPDIRKLKRNAVLRKKLLRWLTDPKHFKAIDEGTFVLPEKFLAKSAVSVAPRGLARLANRPFKQLFKERDFRDLDYTQGRFVKSPKALLRRLDSRSCTGCHQSRSVAGFHMLGEDPASMKVDALGYGHSDHLQQDLERRRAFNLAMLENQADPARGFAERLEDQGVYGSRCGLGDPGFSDWTCGPGLQCKALDDRELGACAPADAPQVGDSCAVGTLRTKAVGHKDRVRDVVYTACAPDHVCESNPVGFPNGMCAGTCESGGSESTCGAIAILTPFNRCLAKGHPFPKCITENVRPAGLRKCSTDAPCRDDYICARGPSGEGACIPPYFLFQLRVDGH